MLNRARATSPAVTVFSGRGERFPGLQAFAVKDLPPTEVAEHEARARALLGPGPESVRWSPATILSVAGRRA